MKKPCWFIEKTYGNWYFEKKKSVCHAALPAKFGPQQQAQPF
jgi:hypothetical protein